MALSEFLSSIGRDRLNSAFRFVLESAYAPGWPAGPLSAGRSHAGRTHFKRARRVSRRHRRISLREGVGHWEGKRGKGKGRTGIAAPSSRSPRPGSVREGAPPPPPAAGRRRRIGGRFCAARGPAGRSEPPAALAPGGGTFVGGGGRAAASRRIGAAGRRGPAGADPRLPFKPARGGDRRDRRISGESSE